MHSFAALPLPLPSQGRKPSNKTLHDIVSLETNANASAIEEGRPRRGSSTARDERGTIEMQSYRDIQALGSEEKAKRGRNAPPQLWRIPHQQVASQFPQNLRIVQWRRLLPGIADFPLPCCAGRPTCGCTACSLPSCLWLGASLRSAAARLLSVR